MRSLFHLYVVNSISSVSLYSIFMWIAQVSDVISVVVYLEQCDRVRIRVIILVFLTILLVRDVCAPCVI